MIHRLLRRPPAYLFAMALAAASVFTSPALAAPVLPPQASPVAESHVPSCGPAAAGTARCHALVRTDTAARRSTPARPGTKTPTASPNAVGNNGAYDPAYLQSAYVTPSAANGAGQTIAIVDAYDAPHAESDLGTYRSYFGLSACTSSTGCFRKVNQNGQSSPLPAADGGWAQETSLDLDMASAICPNCSILLVEANSASFTDLATAVNTAARMGAVAISNSYGGSEWSGETSIDSAYNHPGVAVTVSSGDSGYGVQYPSASPYVTAVGGTTLNQATNTGTRNATETVWSGAGSGCSAYESKPAWQKDTGCGRRTATDASAVGDPNTGVWVYDSYAYQGQSGWLIFGGTSVASPIVAGVYALAGKPGAADYPSSYLYASPSGLNDITSGSNGTCSTAYLCTGEVGYDGPTGLGTPNGVSAFSAVAPTPSFSLSASPSSASVSPGGVASYTVTATASNGYSSPVGLSVSGLPAGATASFSPGSITPTGSSTLSVATTSSTPAGSYTLTITGTGTDAATTTKTTSATLQVVVPDFSMAASPSALSLVAGSSGTSTVTVTGVGGYSSSVALSASGTFPSGVSVSLNPTSVIPAASGATSTLAVSTAASTPAGSFSVTVTGTGTDGTTHSTTVSVTVTGDFAVSASPSSQTVSRGGSTTYAVDLTTLNAYGSAVTLSVSGLPSRTTASFSQNPVTPSAAGTVSTLTVSTNRRTPRGTSTLTITAKGSDGTTHTTSVALTVQ